MSTNIDIEMVFVEGGSFTMGCTPEQKKMNTYNGKPRHEVILDDYYIGKNEVTQAQWKEIMGEDHNPSWFKGDNLPVENVSWEKIQKFIGRLNQKTGKNYRLPTEAEWEYAARGGKKSKGYKYSGSNNANTVAWYEENSEDKTHPVGTKNPNELEIYDMSGNVEEWCNDWYKDYSSSTQTNPQGASTGAYRVVRGGSWCSDTEKMLVSFRSYYAPNARDNDLGFRLAHDREKKDEQVDK